MSQDDKKEQRRFSTFELPNRDQVERWREYMSNIYYKLDIQTAAPAGVCGLLRERTFDKLSISKFESNAHIVRRRGSDAGHDGSDDYVLIFPVAGTFSYQQRRGSAQVEPGDVFLLSSSENYSVQVSQNAQNITLKIPAELLRGQVPWIDEFCGTSGFAAPEIVTLLSHFSTDMMRINSESQRLSLETACFDIIKLLAEEGRNSVMGQRIAGGRSACCSKPYILSSAATSVHTTSTRPRPRLTSACLSAMFRRS